MGESADNLPGVPGVGPKTAAKWINLYGGLEGVLENLDAIGGKVGDSLRENVEEVKRNRRLNRLHTDLDLPVTLDELAEPRPDQAALEELFDALEFKTIRTRLFALYGSEVAEAERESLETPDFVIPSDAAELAAFLESGAGKRSAVAVDLVPGRIGEDAAALAIVHDDGAAYIDLASQDAAAENVLAGWLRDAGAAKVMHGYKAALKALSSRRPGPGRRGGRHLDLRIPHPAGPPQLRTRRTGPAPPQHQRLHRGGQGRASWSWRSTARTTPPLPARWSTWPPSSRP